MSDGRVRPDPATTADPADARAPAPLAPGTPLPGFAIRDWQADDLAAIIAIENASFPFPWTEDQFRGELTNAVARGLVVTTQCAPAAAPSVVAFSLSWKVLDELHLLILAVDPRFRRRGLGVWLLDELVRRGQAEGVAAVSLEVRPSNTAARNLYYQYGFKDVAVRRRYYADGEDAMILVASLADLALGD